LSRFEGSRSVAVVVAHLRALHVEAPVDQILMEDTEAHRVEL
jgi:hypothetical protein